MPTLTLNKSVILQKRPDLAKLLAAKISSAACHERQPAGRTGPTMRETKVSK